MNRPELILLCGIPGAGKTHFAQKLLQDACYMGKTVHLSSDAIRAELWGNEAIQDDNNQVFNLMRTRAIEALSNGQNVIYDSTAMSRKDRAPIIAACPKFAKIRCYIVWAPIEVCIERDATRERTVGKEVIDRMLKRFQAPFFDEGFDDIYVHCSVDNFDTQKYLQDIIDAMKIPHDNPHHTLDIFEHCAKAARYIEEREGPYTAVWAASILHDAGKPYVKAFVNSKGEPCEQAHFYQHQCIGAWQFYGTQQMLNMSYSDFLKAAWLISVHMDPYLNTKYYYNLPAYLKSEVDLLHEADAAAH